MRTKRINRIAMFLCCTLTVLAVGIYVRDILFFEEMKSSKMEQQQKLVAVKLEIDQINQSLQRFQREQEDFTKLLFNEKDVPAFLEGISQYAQQTEVNILDVKTNKYKTVKVPQQMKEQSTLVQKRSAGSAPDDDRWSQLLTLSALPIMFKVEGSFPDLVSFFSHLEEFKQLLSISNVEIKTNSKYPILRCGFTLKIYSLKDLKELERAFN